ncbi:uncharacterized protein [Anas platyrhynchos]|uniref:uncharacterized protein isoform X2 n=2 Tax=Anas platyrhynchos TaxID=8839 RepID=UPI003AF306D1
MRGLWQKQVENSHRPATAGRGATARNRSADGKQEKLLHCFAVLAGCGTSPGSAGLPSGLVSVSVCDTGRVTGGSDPSGSTGSTVKENQRAAAGGSRWEDARCTSVLKTRIGEPQQRRRGKRAAKGAKAATRAHRPRTQRGRTRPHSQQQPRGAREGRGAERYGAARSGTERYGAERSGTERSGAERSGTERYGADRHARSCAAPPARLGCGRAPGPGGSGGSCSAPGASRPAATRARGGARGGSGSRAGRGGAGAGALRPERGRAPARLGAEEGPRAALGAAGPEVPPGALEPPGVGGASRDTVHACKLPRSILPKTRRSSGDDHRKNMWSLSGSGRAHLGYGWWKVFSLSFKARTSALLRGAVPAALLLHMRGAGRLA